MLLLKESIQHLIFGYCHVVKLMWNALYCAFGIVLPSVADLFGAWRNCFPSKFQKTVLIGAAALCWAVWISHNDVIIENCTTKLSFCGSSSERPEQFSILRGREAHLDERCQHLETTVLEIFNNFGWKIRNIIER